MHARARELIDTLRLAPHPEGGFYRETWRSTLQVSTGPGRERAAATHIHFLLAAGGFSAWHRVSSDETWCWHEGGVLELLLATPGVDRIERRRLGRVAEGCEPSSTVPALWWQAARPLGDYALCGCSVAPGFEFADFSFLRDAAGKGRAALARLAPDLLELL